MHEATWSPIDRFHPALLASLLFFANILTGSAAMAQDAARALVPVPPPSLQAARLSSAAGSPGVTTSRPYSGGWWMGSTGLALVLAICGAICLAARKYRPGDAAVPLRVVGRVSLASRHSIFMVRVGRRVLLVGTGSQGAPSLLGELYDDDQIDETNDSGAGAGGSEPEPRAETSAAAPGFSAMRGLDVRLGDE